MNEYLTDFLNQDVNPHKKKVSPKYISIKVLNHLVTDDATPSTN